VFAAAAAAPILNVDATGNPSQILGTLTVDGVGSAGSPVFVANANGIVVGAGSVITAPGGLGLINADLTSSKAQAVFEASSSVPVSFIGASGGVQISAGANLSNVGTFLLVAGAGNVNVSGAFVSNSGNTSYGIPASTTIPVTIDAGLGGYAGTTTGVFTVADSGNATPFASMSATATHNVYQDAANSTVNLNLGITTSPYDASKLTVLADGNVNIASGADLTNVTSASVQWIGGTFTNNGTVDFGDQTGSVLLPTTAAGDIGTSSYASSYEAIYANTAKTQAAGAFVNTGLVNAGSITVVGSSFSNSGTLQMGESGSFPALAITALGGNINLGGTVSVVSVAGNSLTHFDLASLKLSAASTAGQSVTIGTALPLVSGASGATIAATNVTLNNSLTVSSGNNFVFTPFAAATPVSGSFVIASGATLSAGNLHLGSTATSGKFAQTSYLINGSMVANSSSTTPTITMGGLHTNSHAVDGKNSVYNISGAGSITAGQLTIASLLGAVNNITSGQILANGFQLNAAGGSTGTIGISVTANGAAPQGFNVKVKGNATIDSGTTVAVATQKPAGNATYGQYLYPANANSNLVVQASGGLTVNAGTGTDSYNLGSALFQWPGLVYLQANGGNLTSTTSIANAYAAQAATGHAGVFLIAKNITDSFPIYTNGNAGVVFAAPYSASLGIYPYAQTINGVNPSTTNPGLPTVYFATANPTVANANFSLQPLSSFTNEKGYQQENQTFLTRQ
jgi:filamentous hemagglutinin family protein